LSIRILALVFFCGTAIASAQNERPSPTPSTVYSIHDSAAIRDFRTNPTVVRRMVDRLLIAVTGQPDIGRAWASLIAPNDKVGIKISAAGGELFSTHRDVVNAIVDGLVAGGHPRRDIIVWDRQLNGITDATYRGGAEGYRLVGIEPRTGYDAKAVFSSAVMGKLVWGDLEYVPRHGENPLETETGNTSSISHFAHIVSSGVDKIIDVPVMSDSAATGLAGCLYNMTLPNIDNWRRFAQYGSMGAGGIAEIYSDPTIQKKVVLHIMDGLIASYADGPESHPNYAVHYATLLASKDAVAIDTVALQRIEDWRVNAKLPPIGNLAAHVEIAARMGLGNADRKLIKVFELEH
jgi:uncharacterized protein DUF362